VVIEGKVVVCMVVDITKGVEIVTKNKAIHLSETRDVKLYLHIVVGTICVVNIVDIIPAKHRTSRVSNNLLCCNYLLMTTVK
jgi:hypothetical protein